MNSARLGRLVSGSRKAWRASWSSRRGNWLISSVCCSMVASILANELINVPISSLRFGTTGISDALVAVASWAAREMAEATSHTTNPPPAMSRPVKMSRAGIVKASVYWAIGPSIWRTGAWKA